MVLSPFSLSATRRRDSKNTTEGAKINKILKTQRQQDSSRRTPYITPRTNGKSERGEERGGRGEDERRERRETFYDMRYGMARKNNRTI